MSPSPAPRIQRLSDPVINKIAAGEVIERPASVLKELVENSLDAGATRLDLQLEAGGKNFIQVTDNGQGMGPEDALLCLERHATSKLSSFDDLETVATLGFRGEALPSIAGVSRLELQTRRAGDPEGIRVRVANGEIKDVGPVACAEGTRITVRNLFYSTPVRRKFLTGNRNELRHCLVLLRRLALARPEVGFRLTSDGELIEDWPAGDGPARLVQVFGSEMPERLMPVEYKDSGIRITGQVGKVNTFRRSHGDQYLFVNGRAITSRVINHAVFSAYGHTLERDQVPFFLLFLEIDPQRLDVNVHPTKKEVRFEDEHYLHRSVNLAVIKALSGRTVRNFDLNPGGAGVDPRITVARPEPGAPDREPTADTGRFPGRQRLGGTLVRGEFGGARPGFTSQADLFQNPAERQAVEQGVREYLDSASQSVIRFHALPPGSRDPETRQEGDRLGRSPFLQLHNTYLFVEVESGVVIIDQHAAHERVLFERCHTAMVRHSGSSQRLLFPLDLQLDTADQLLFEEVLPLLFDMGFTMELDQDDQQARVRITGIPADLGRAHPEGLVGEILDQYRIYSSTMPDPLQAMAASVACKAAIKAGQPLSDLEIRSLLDSLFACQQPFTCPHGRPVVINLGLAELHRRFGRS